MPLSSSSWTCRHRSAVVAARLPSFSGGPAAAQQEAVRGDFLPDGFGQAVPQVPAVAGLDSAGQRAADRLAVGAGPVPAHDLDARDDRAATPPATRPSGRAGHRPAARSRRRSGWSRRRGRGAARSRRRPAPGARSPGSGSRSSTRSAVCRETGTPSAVSRPRPARPANSRATALTWPVSPGPPLVAVQHARDLLPECLHRAVQGRAPHPPHPDPHHDRPPVRGHVRRPSARSTRAPGRSGTAPRARHRPARRPRPDHDHAHPGPSHPR